MKQVLMLLLLAGSYDVSCSMASESTQLSRTTRLSSVRPLQIPSDTTKSIIALYEPALIHQVDTTLTEKLLKSTK